MQYDGQCLMHLLSLVVVYYSIYYSKSINVSQ